MIISTQNQNIVTEKRSKGLLTVRLVMLISLKFNISLKRY